MGIPIFLALFCIFLGWLTIKRLAASKKEQEQTSQFWKKEDEANSTRKQDISNLPYIHIPIDTLPFGCSTTEEVRQQETILKDICDKPILNLTGITNTDLKLQYGAANLPFLSECDERFTSMCRAIYEWGYSLYEEGFLKEARQVLEFGIQSGSDVTGNYTLLGKIYHEAGDTFLITNLLANAKRLNSLSKDIIILKLSEFVHN